MTFGEQLVDNIIFKWIKSHLFAHSETVESTTISCLRPVKCFKVLQFIAYKQLNGLKYCHQKLTVIFV